MSSSDPGTFDEDVVLGIDLVITCTTVLIDCSATSVKSGYRPVDGTLIVEDSLSWATAVKPVPNNAAMASGKMICDPFIMRFSIFIIYYYSISQNLGYKHYSN